MRVAGMGLIFSRGLGVPVLEKALQDGWQQPEEIVLPWQKNGKTPVYQVRLDSVSDKTLLKKIRRADKVSKMSVLAAADAVSDSGIENILQKRIGMIVATALGAHVTTFSFLDDILNYGDAAVSPTTFSNSVHNAAASYVSSSLAFRGPTLTVTQFQFSFETALQLAQAWLEQDRCEYVLLGAVDEYGDVLAYVSDQKLTTAGDGKVQPFAFDKSGHVPGEGAIFFLLSPDTAGKSYCAVDASNRLTGSRTRDIDIIHANGLMDDESAYRSGLSMDVPVADYAPIFGSMMINSAFNAGCGALMLKRQKVFANPVQDNPHNLRLLTETKDAAINSIACTGYDCFGEQSVVLLTR